MLPLGTEFDAIDEDVNGIYGKTHLAGERISNGILHGSGHGSKGVSVDDVDMKYNGNIASIVDGDFSRTTRSLASAFTHKPDKSGNTDPGHAFDAFGSQRHDGLKNSGRDAQSLQFDLVGHGDTPRRQ